VRGGGRREASELLDAGEALEEIWRKVSHAGL
jgi:hypothetical protein